jgi:hypothetical protein
MTMAQGISLHIGLNHVDPAKYDGWDGQLAGCLNDASDMQELSQSLGYTPSSLIDDAATAARVSTAIKKTAAALQPGDAFFLSYSGHGGQVQDTNGDEAKRDEYEVGKSVDALDETWVLFDRQFADDELWALWALFAPKVRITVFSDSCHSGTVTRAIPVAPITAGVRTRQMPPALSAEDDRRRSSLYRRIQRSVPPREASSVKATVLLVSGCADNQTSADGDRNGLFTEELLQAWDKGHFNGSTRLLRDEVARRMPPQQTPNYYAVGAKNRAFVGQQALKI